MIYMSVGGGGGGGADPLGGGGGAVEPDALPAVGVAPALPY